MEKLVGKNYFLNQSGKEAFKAYVRAYDSHQLKTIFDISTLDLQTVAKSFGFLTPPVVDLSKSLFEFSLIMFFETNFSLFRYRNQLHFSRSS